MQTVCDATRTTSNYRSQAGTVVALAINWDDDPHRRPRLRACACEIIARELSALECPTGIAWSAEPSQLEFLPTKARAILPGLGAEKAVNAALSILEGLRPVHCEQVVSVAVTHAGQRDPVEFAMQLCVAVPPGRIWVDEAAYLLADLDVRAACSPALANVPLHDYISAAALTIELTGLGQVLYREVECIP